MLLRLANIACFYGPRLIFKNVSLTVPEGSVTLLAGANGAGKSTLLKIMAGLINPSEGEIFLDESRGVKEPAIGYLGHQTFIYPDLNALENLRFWTALHGKILPASAFEEALQRVDLAAFAEEKAGSFSRGMAQRLNLARVFLLAPRILLLDEPGTGLDARSTAVLYREIAAAKASGAGIVWITHSLAEDMRHADAVALLETKKLAFWGSVEAYCATGDSPAPSSRPELLENRKNRGGGPC